jgi:hypothetical protein
MSPFVFIPCFAQQGWIGYSGFGPARTVASQQAQKKSDKKKTDYHQDTGHADRPEKELESHDFFILECNDQRQCR